MTITNIIFDNFVTLCLIAGLGVLICTNRTFDKRSTRYFTCFIAIVLLLDISDMGDFYMRESTTLNNWRYFTSAMSYTLRPSSLAIVINILLRRKKFNLWLWAPIIALSVVAFTSRFTHIMFWFDDQNLFCRGSLGYASHVLSAMYALLLVFATIRSQHTIDVGECIVIAYIVVICVLATWAETVLFEKFLLTGAMTVSCALYYIFLYVQTYKRDALTGLWNRRSLYADVEKINHQGYVVISMDLNCLKELNDTYGHHAGDSALRTLADISMTVARNKYRVYRTGGDEFIALGRDKSEKDAAEYIDAMRAALGKTEYMASFGYALYDGKSSFDEICNRADASMYSDKMHYKHRSATR